VFFSIAISPLILTSGAKGSKILNLLFIAMSGSLPQRYDGEHSLLRVLTLFKQFLERPYFFSSSRLVSYPRATQEIPVFPSAFLSVLRASRYNRLPLPPKSPSTPPATPSTFPTRQFNCLFPLVSSYAVRFFIFILQHLTHNLVSLDRVPILFRSLLPCSLRNSEVLGLPSHNLPLRLTDYSISWVQLRQGAVSIAYPVQQK